MDILGSRASPLSSAGRLSLISPIMFAVDLRMWDVGRRGMTFDSSLSIKSDNNNKKEC
jgi:hypothetical protein